MAGPQPDKWRRRDETKPHLPVVGKNKHSHGIDGPFMDDLPMKNGGLP